MTEKDLGKFFDVLMERSIRLFKGYPSAIYDFLKEIEIRCSSCQKELLKSKIKYCIFNSELPTCQIIDYIKHDWGMNFISGYGHTESCVLAYTNVNSELYFPYHTYGFAEVEDKMLIGTSYHNFDMPLIRYNTEDIVDADYFSNGILKSFIIKEGRVINTIFDKNDLRIAIQSILLGVKPSTFEHLNYLQFFQEQKGKAVVIISQDNYKDLDYMELLNLNKYNMEFDFVFKKRPIRTKSQKVPLRIFELPKQ